MPGSASFGLHVGNTTTSIAVQRDGRCDVVANPAGDRVTPCAVGWPSTSEVIVGLTAKQHAGRFPRSTVKKGNKSLIGTTTDDDIVQKLAQLSGKETAKIATEAAAPLYQIEIQDEKAKNIAPKEVHYHIIKYMHDIALTQADDDELKAVLTVPLKWTAEQRELVNECAEKAGFHTVQIISEPAAAVLAYNLGQVEPAAQKPFHCLVYRSGGASTTATVLYVNGGFVNVLGQVEKRVGGDDATKLLANYLAKEFTRKYHADPTESKRSMLKLMNNAETVKHVLATLDTGNCYIESLHEGIDFNTNVTRARFDNEFSKKLSDMVEPIEDVLEEVGLKSEDIAKVILAGGNAKVLKLQKYVKDMFDTSEVLTSIQGDEVLATGAALQAGLLNQKWDASKPQPEIQALNYSIVYTVGDSNERETLVPKGCPIPVRRSTHLEHSSKEPVSVSISLESSNKDVINVGKLTLTELQDGTKLSFSAHVLRDGGLHLALTEKNTGKTTVLDVNPASKQ